MAGNDSTAKLNILVQLRDEATQAMSNMGNALSDLGGNLGFAGDKAGILAGAFAALGVATISKTMAAYDEANLKLVTSQNLLKNLPGGMKLYAEAIKVGNEAEQKFGFDNEQTTLSLSKFLKVTNGDMPHALQALKAAMGMAIEKFGGPDGLEAATTQTMRAFTGGGRMLKEFGEKINDNESAMSAIAKVAEHTTPYLDAWGETAAKNSEVTKQFGNDVMEYMGEPLVKAKNWLMNFITGTENTQVAIEKLAPFWKGLGVAVAVVTTVLTAQTLPALANTAAGFLGLEAAGSITLGTIAVFTATVLGWTIAIAAAIAIGYLIIDNWGAIKKYLADTWAGMKLMAVDSWNAIVNFFKTLPESLGEIFGAMVVGIVKWMADLYKFFTTTIPATIAQLVAWFAELPGKVVNALASLPNKALSIFQSAAASIKGVFQDVINFIANAPNSIVDFGKGAINNFIGVVNGFVQGFNKTAGKVGLSLPEIPKFANGGIVTSPTIGLIGEAGPEAIIPLSRMGSMGGGGSINIYLTGDVYSTAEVAEKFANEIARVIKYQIRT